jgi:hypothetical protein
MNDSVIFWKARIPVIANMSIAYSTKVRKSSGQLENSNTKNRFNSPLDRKMHLPRNTVILTGISCSILYFLNRFKIYKSDGTLIKDI